MKALRIILLLIIIGVLALLVLGGNKKQNIDTFQDQTFVFVDENEMAVSAEFSGEGVRVTMPDGQVYDLTQTISASGARYANEDESFVFWNKGDEVTIFENDEVTFSGTTRVVEQEVESDIEAETEIGESNIGEVEREEAIDAEFAPVPGAHVGTWTWIETVYPTAEGGLPPQPRSDVFTLTLGTDGTVSGTTDCNGFGGAYRVSDDNVIDFGDGFWSTLMYCEGSQEADFTGLLMRAHSIYQPAVTTLILELEHHAGQIIFERK